ncbi:hypothetical protein BC567DRAFT_229785 [Phyllosticta citribraziliensis]
MAEKATERTEATELIRPKPRSYLNSVLLTWFERTKSRTRTANKSGRARCPVHVLLHESGTAVPIDVQDPLVHVLMSSKATRTRRKALRAPWQRPCDDMDRHVSWSRAPANQCGWTSLKLLKARQEAGASVGRGVDFVCPRPPRVQPRRFPSLHFGHRSL